MKRFVLPITALLFVLTGQVARAQNVVGRPPTTPFSRPAISPFLGLTARGGSPALNYLTIVQPQLQAQNEIQQLQAQAATTQGYLDNTALLSTPIATTGTGSRFMTQNRYFMTAGRAGTGTGTAAPFTQPVINSNLGVR